MIDRDGARGQPLRDDAAAGLPRRHQREDERADEDGDPSPLRDLQQVRTEEREVHREEHGGHRVDRRLRPSPALDRDHVQQDCRDDHRHRHRDAVGGGERV